MIQAVFLCDTKWKITRIRQCSEELLLHEGDVLSDLILEKEPLQYHTENHYALELTFFGQNLTIPAVIDSFKEGNLVILAQVKDPSELTEFHNEYSSCLDWAKTHLIGLYHDEYFLIQQMNNQLIDAKRSLVRSNRQLEQILEENKKINEQLEKAKVYAEQANSSKTKFLSNMSHDIRTPMNAIVGLAELMQHHLGEPKLLKKYISKLQSSSQYLLDLINDILDLSKIENGSMKLKMEPMNMGEQIEQLITIIRPQITEKKQKLSVQCNLEELGWFNGDPVRFRQVLMNILSNAVKYTPEGGTITFTVQETGKTEQTRNYRFVMEDSGIGMTETFMEHIFEPFSRAESSVGEIQGTGLGMAITKNIVDAMGGTIRVESTPGKGSSFFVELSFEMCQGEHAAKWEEESQISLQGMNFLCAEDNELNAEILTSILELEGASCVIYENGKALAEAFETVKEGDYDAILMDVQMPVMNGYEATRQIRNSKNPLGRSIPVIAMTANAFSEDARRCIEAGMDAHIAKPVDIALLKQIMYRCISVADR